MVQRLNFLLIVVSLTVASALAQTRSIQGKVQDESGLPVIQARVLVVFSDGSVAETRTRQDGSFDVAEKGGLPARLQIIATGFGIAQENVDDGLSAPLSLTLHPWRLSNSVTVTASRSEIALGDSTQNIMMFDRVDREMSPAITVDDFLRAVPGFALFRRSSSLVANPTSQGVSLRGVGPSGASRSLVLADGLSLNDPFGGWVYWGRVPRIAIDRTDVLRGGASELYGTDALGGVIQLFRREPSRATLNAEAMLGNFNSYDYAFYGSHRLGRHGVALAGEFFRTSGYIQVAPESRGPVDVAATSKHYSLEALWDYRFTPESRAFVLASQFSEDRGNGTPLQKNDTQIRSLAAGLSFITGGRDLWTVQAFTLAETFDASFSSVSLNRSTESLTRRQRVPALSSGFQGLWRRNLGLRHHLVAGMDYAQVRGASDELTYATGRATGTVRSDGRQDRTGLYLQDLIRLAPRLQVVLGIRRDSWENHDAFSFSRSFATDSVRQAPFTSHSDTAWSPKLAARFDLSSTLALRGSLSRSFRAPTLNELYRSFRVGNVVTEANPDLKPERAKVDEIGLDWSPRSSLAVRTTFFWYEIDGNIANVTLTSTPTLITRQRQNLGATRSRGLELDAVFHPDRHWTFSAGYFLSDATVRDAPRSPDLVGLRIPQVPRHQAVLQASYRHEERFFLRALMRLGGSQFDDDQNVFRLGSYRIFDLTLGRPFARQAELVFACENVFNTRYAVGRTPVETLGMPRRLHGGIRLRFE